MHAQLSVPVTCKIRVLPTLEATLELAKGLQDSGCAVGAYILVDDV